MSPRFTDASEAPRRGVVSTRESADLAYRTRKSVEGLSGIGAGRKDRSFTVKRVLRIVLGFLLIIIFCAVLYIAAWKAEVIGGKTIPDVVGWRQDRAVATIENAGFTNVVTAEVAADDVQAGMVVSVEPSEGMRVEADSTITVNVAAAQASE